jgi:hypothetical protein
MYRSAGSFGLQVGFRDFGLPVSCSLKLTKSERCNDRACVLICATGQLDTRLGLLAGHSTKVSLRNLDSQEEQGCSYWIIWRRRTEIQPVTRQFFRIASVQWEVETRSAAHKNHPARDGCWVTSVGDKSSLKRHACWGVSISFESIIG